MDMGCSRLPFSQNWTNGSSKATRGPKKKQWLLYISNGGLKPISANTASESTQKIHSASEWATIVARTTGIFYTSIHLVHPRGVLLYGPPGTGKTMLAKAVAHHTTAAFIRVVGSEFVQKYLGEGPRMVRDVFRLAKENAPAIIFIDEVDAISTARFDAQTEAKEACMIMIMGFY
ncbi:hypothetical protein LOK49_LG01G01992 [Camellia lanceoleosa]|uniref:Uncharacterized protein n=1 Tax=Camellia lanceoleosa TaxID=1840588 RepID=A0ACC0IUX3_9ERIC|nr:hypothetical protein LOK49_LG01G01992 [Camellia lanceoleosa]